MDNKNNKDLFNIIKNKKLYNIQLLEKRLIEYQNAFNVIRENNLVKFTKNSSSGLLRLGLGLISILLFLIGIGCFFPEKIFEIIDSYGYYITIIDDNFINEEYKYFASIFICLSSVLIFINILIKRNSVKRNVIFDLSNLLKNVISDVDRNLKEEKLRYEFFLDSQAEINEEEANFEAETYKENI